MRPETKAPLAHAGHRSQWCENAGRSWAQVEIPAPFPYILQVVVFKDKSMQHPLSISRRIEYGLRAMLFLAGTPEGVVVPFREIARKMDVPEDFLAKILKRL